MTPEPNPTNGSYHFEQLNPDSCRSYLIGCLETKQAVLVDPVLAHVDHYLDLLKQSEWTLRWAIDTHTHADHISAGTYLSRELAAEYLMHKKSANRQAAHNLDDGTRLELGTLGIDVLETPGHTKDSVSLRLPGKVLTGDWLFVGGAGRCDLPGGDPGEHWDSLARVIPRLEDEVLVFPGHDYQNHTSSSVGEEKARNMNLAPRSRDAYVAWLHAAKQETPSWMIDTIRANNEGTLDKSVNFMPEGAAARMCQPALLSNAIPTIQPEDVKDLVDHPAPDGERLFLDVRQPEEYTGPLGHVPGTKLIPLGELPSRVSEIENYKDKTVIAICKSGGRSGQATEFLLKQGFQTVLNMVGGTQGWNQKGFEVER